MSHRLFFLVCALCLSGCQSIVGMQVGPDYDKSKFSPVLEMPPDLLSSGGQQTVPMAALEAGADALVVDAKAEDVWPLAKSLLEKAGFTIAKADEKQGMLETDWLEQRTGLSAMLGARVAATLREKYALTLKPEGETKIALQVEYTKQRNASQGWQDAGPDARRGRAFLDKVQEALRALQARRDMAGLTVERLQDQAGDYLILNFPPAKVQAPIKLALTSLGYNIVGMGPGAYEFLVEAQPRAQSRPFVSEFFAQMGEGVRSALASDSDIVAARQMRLRLSPDQKGPGAVLEVLPDSIKTNPRQQDRLLDALVAYLSSAK